MKEKLILAKEKAAKLKQYIEKIHKIAKIKPTKKSKIVIDAIDRFMRCNLSDKSIYSKYEYLKNIVEASAKSGEIKINEMSKDDK